MLYYTLRFVSDLLEESDLDLLTQELTGVKRKWYDIGWKLGLIISVKNIRSKYSDSNVCLKMMLREQLQYTTNWRNIVDSLKSPGVRKSQLADQLEAKYCPSEFTNNNVLLYFSEYNAVHYTCSSLLCECIQCEVLRYLN